MQLPQTDATVFRQFEIDSWFDAQPLTDSATPGQPINFSWRVNPVSAAHWVDARIELKYVDEGTGEVRALWSRHTGWPPEHLSEHPAPGSTPFIPGVTPDPSPADSYTVEHPAFDPPSRLLVYHGFARRHFRVTLTATLADGSSFSADRDFFVQIVREPHFASWAQLVAPTEADWNSTYNVDCQARTDATAHFSATLTLGEFSHADDATSNFSGNFNYRPPFAPAVDHLAVRLPNWRWYELPTYHADPEKRVHTFTYTLQVAWIDEFNNSYDLLTLTPRDVNVRVSEAKWLSAAAAEFWFWFWIVVAGAVLLTILSFGILGAASAGAAAGLAGAAALAGPGAATTQATLTAAATAASNAAIAAWGGAIASAAGAIAAPIGPFQIGAWQELANDPIAADPRIWEYTGWPEILDVVFEPDVEKLRQRPDLHPTAAPAVLAATRLPFLIGAATATYQRMLGAKAANSTHAFGTQLKQLESIRDDITTNTAALGSLQLGLFKEAPTAKQITEILEQARSEVGNTLEGAKRARLDELVDTLVAAAPRGARVLAGHPGRLQSAMETATYHALTSIERWRIEQPPAAAEAKAEA